MIRLCGLLLAALSATSAVAQQAAGTFSADAARYLGGPRGQADPEPPMILGPRDIDEYLAAQRAEMLTRLALARKGQVGGRAAKLKTGYDSSRGRYVFRTAADKKAEIDRLEAELDDPRLPSLHIGEKRIGRVGSLRDEHGLRFRVLQVIDDDNAIVEMGRWAFWIVSPLAGSLRDDRNYQELPGTWYISGSKTYPTVLGSSRTVDLLGVYELGPHLARLKEPQKQAAVKKVP